MLAARPKRGPASRSSDDRAAEQSRDQSSRPGSDAGRDETPTERIDRNLRELMEELRVAIIGVQILFGFLLALPFTAQFSKIDDWQRALYTADLSLAALATALLV